MTSARDKAAANEPNKPAGIYRAAEVLPGRTTPGGEDKLGLLDAAGAFHYLDDDGKIAKGKPRDLFSIIAVDTSWPAVSHGPEYLRQQAQRLIGANAVATDFGAPAVVDVTIPILLDEFASALEAERAPRMDEPTELGTSVLAHSLGNPDRRRFVRFAAGGTQRQNTWTDGFDTYITWEQVLDPQPWPMPESAAAAARPALASVPQDGEQS